MPIERLQALDNVEKEIATCIQSAGNIGVRQISWFLNGYVSFVTGQAVQELSKDKPSQKQVEGHTNQFIKTLSRLENELSQHINYLTQVSTGIL